MPVRSPSRPSTSSATCARETRDAPLVPVTTCPVRTSMPRRSHSRAQRTGACARASTTAATSTPASLRSTAAA